MTAQPNAELAYRVLDHIDANPKSWDQATWGCGTVACFAGWAVQLSGGVIDPDGYDSNVVAGPAELVGKTVEVAAQKLLAAEVWIERPDGEMNWLFAPANTREALGRLVAEIFGPRPDGAAVDSGGCPPGGCIPNFCVGADDCRREYDSNGDVIYDEDDLPPNAGSAS